jgi:hypothetical protein
MMKKKGTGGGRPCTSSHYVQDDVQDSEWGAEEDNFVEDEFADEEVEGEFIEAEEDSSEDDFISADEDSDSGSESESDEEEDTPAAASSSKKGVASPMFAPPRHGVPALHGVGAREEVKVVHLDISKRFALQEAYDKCGICWKVKPSCAKEVFCCTHSHGGNLGGIVRHAKPLGDLKNAVIVGATVTGFRNTSGLQIGVDIPGVHPTSTANGSKKFSFIVPNTIDYIPKTKIIFNGLPNLDTSALRHFSSMNPEKLREGLTLSEDKSYYFVQKSHPLIETIFENSKNDSFNMNHKEFVESLNSNAMNVEVPCENIDMILEKIECHLMDERPCTDLSEFKICFSRADCKEWNDCSGICNVYQGKSACAPCGPSPMEKQAYLCDRFDFQLSLDLYIVYPDMPKKC